MISVAVLCYRKVVPNVFQLRRLSCGWVFYDTLLRILLDYFVYNKICKFKLISVLDVIFNSFSRHFHSTEPHLHTAVNRLNYCLFTEILPQHLTSMYKDFHFHLLSIKDYYDYTIYWIIITLYIFSIIT